jgi:hypothetical protein
VTFETETTRGSTVALRLLVVVFIIVVAVWASLGGLDQLLAAEPEPAPISASD